VQTDVSHTQNQVSFFETLKMFCKPAKLTGALLLFATWALFFSSTATSVRKVKLNYFFAAVFACVLVTSFAAAPAYSSLTFGRIWFVTDVSFFVLLSAIVIKYAQAPKNIYKTVAAVL